MQNSAGSVPGSGPRPAHPTQGTRLVTPMYRPAEELAIRELAIRELAIGDVSGDQTLLELLSAEDLPSRRLDGMAPRSWMLGGLGAAAAVILPVSLIALVGLHSASGSVTPTPHSTMPASNSAHVSDPASASSGPTGALGAAPCHACLAPPDHSATGTAAPLAGAARSGVLGVPALAKATPGAARPAAGMAGGSPLIAAIPPATRPSGGRTSPNPPPPTTAAPTSSTAGPPPTTDPPTTPTDPPTSTDTTTPPPPDAP